MCKVLTLFLYILSFIIVKLILSPVHGNLAKKKSTEVLTIVHTSVKLLCSCASHCICNASRSHGNTSVQKCFNSRLLKSITFRKTFLDLKILHCPTVHVNYIAMTSI